MKESFLKRYWNKITMKTQLSPLRVSIEATIAMFAILTVFKFDLMHLTALGSSCFAAFAVPNDRTAQTRNLIGSYLIAIPVGMLFSLLITLPGINIIPFSLFIAGALAVGITMFLLITFKLEHPPSAGIALGFVIHTWTWQTSINLLLAISFLALFRYVQKKVFISLEKAKK